MTRNDDWTRRSISTGTRVDVRGGFDGSWSRGFEVVSRDDDRYVIRRVSDGWVLPVAFADLDIRRAG